VDQVRLFLQSQDPTLEVDCDGFTSHELGVAVYALMPDPEEGEPGEMVSAVKHPKKFADLALQDIGTLTECDSTAHLPH
jgi:hypothetical protein